MSKLRQQPELEEEFGPANVVHGDLVERICGLELADNELGPGTIVMESPKP
jgi:hypothetical protein